MKNVYVFLLLYKRGIRSIMNELTKLFQNKGVKRVIIFVLIALILYSLRSMINFILLTFIFTFLMDRLVSLVTQKFRINWKLTVLVSYTSIVGFLTYGIIKYLPIVIYEITELVKQVTAFYQQPQENVSDELFSKFLGKKPNLSISRARLHICDEIFHRCQSIRFTSVTRPSS